MFSMDNVCTSNLNFFIIKFEAVERRGRRSKKLELHLFIKIEVLGILLLLNSH